VATITEGQQDKEKFIFAVVRGDMDLNETKLANAVKAKDLRPAHEEEIRQVGAVPGYASPVGLNDVLVVVDDVIPDSPNLVAGANEEGYHLLNVNYGRDYQASIVADIAVAEEGAACPDCGQALRTARGVEVGNIFKLGTRYTDSLGCTYLDKEGKSRSVVMGSYGIGVGRLLACIAEEHNDEHGLIWPITIAPYQVHLVTLKGGEEAADNLYTTLKRNGIEVLCDDRDETPGVKFNDADLIGIPIRLTVSKRSLQQGGVELKFRQEPPVLLVPLDEVPQRVQAEIANLETAIARNVVEVEYTA
jgi:prolyl-tRNA synthetase